MSDTLDIVNELRHVIETLNAEQLEFALCGGLAVVVYGYVRATKDIDVLIEPHNLEPVLNAVADCGFGLRAGPITFASNTAHERTLFRATKVKQNQHLTIDLLLASAVLADVWKSREALDWLGLRVPIVSRAGLATMKMLAGRTQDFADLEALGMGTK